ncbi:DEAD/DEAH box helicase [Methanobacterium paludis]|uniref:RNA helicase n=1 Tax=Methanobacterium paludis (strain DSM 25820 / JCM 18151 / SWAN1) TaxID=868131 RepID=F6D459_METPW|nr:DEAD/DEAH box helicase [Methanobacterium paludis]AEG17481.1 DEAD/DEAH box helicase domain protein [Methanobacterium paludis]
MKKLRFKDLDISSEIENAVADMGFEEATPIQSLAIPHVLDGRDVIGQAQTGTGKTAAFGIPILEMVDPGDRSLQAVILCPTRELAIQVAEEIRKLSKYMSKIKVLPIYGGQPIERQIKALKKGVQVIIGTPGRVMDHMRRGTLKMDSVKIMVLDEADEMLDMGFRDDIEIVLRDMPSERQTLLFSATMSRDILNLTRKYQNNPEFLKVVHQELTVPEIQQIYFEVKEKMKLELLSRLLDIHNFKLSLVFCNTKRRVDKLVTHLQIRGYAADGLHGDMTQSQRDRVMAKFRNGKIEVLVATDVAARGIDVENVEAVFNYDVPNDDEYYVHRIGRTGRAGKTGMAFTFVSGKEIYQLRDIQKYTKTKIEQHQIPSIKDVEAIKTNNFLENVKHVINTEDLEKQVHLIEKMMEEDYSSVEMAAALLKIVMTRETSDVKVESASNDFGDTGASPGMVRFFINVGRKQKIRAKDIIKAINDKTGLTSSSIGKVDVFDKFSFVEVPEASAGEVLSSVSGSRIKGKSVNMEPANKRE